MINIKIKSEANEVLSLIIKHINENLKDAILYEKKEINKLEDPYLVSKIEMESYIKLDSRFNFYFDFFNKEDFLFSLLITPEKLINKYNELNSLEKEILEKSLELRGLIFKTSEQQSLCLFGINKNILIFDLPEKLKINLKEKKCTIIFEKIIDSINKKISLVKINSSSDTRDLLFTLNRLDKINNQQTLDVFSNFNIQKDLESTKNINLNFKFPLSDNYLYTYMLLPEDFNDYYQKLNEMEKEIIEENLKNNGLFFGTVENRGFCIVGINKRLFLNNI